MRGDGDDDNRDGVEMETVYVGIGMGTISRGWGGDGVVTCDCIPVSTFRRDQKQLAHRRFAREEQDVKIKNKH